MNRGEAALNLEPRRSHIELLTLPQIGGKGAVVVFAFAETAVDETDQHDLALEADGFVGGPVDVLVEDVLEAVLLEPQTGDELVVAAQGSLVLQFHAGHDGIDASGVHLGKAKATLLQEQVTGMLGVVQVVGIVDDTFDVALVVAHLHTGFENVLSHIFFTFLFFYFLQILVADAATQAVLAVAVFPLELDEGL